jgi:hypothetical protein
MLDMSTLKEKATRKAQAWRVDFRETAGAADAEAIVIKEPRNLTAVLNPVDAEEMLADASADALGSLTILWVPPGVNTPPGVEHDAEAWMHVGAGPRKGALVRAGIRTVRVFWDEGRALIYANAESLPSALDAVVRFTVAQCDTLALETTMGSTWASIDANAPLTHFVTSRQQRQQQHVNELTELATRMKAMHLRVSNALEQLDRALDESSKRLYSELILAAALYDRIEQLEEPIQFALDQCELANTRLIEAKNAATENSNAMIGFVLEAGIIMLLFYGLHPFW